MREIKFRYVWKNEFSQKVATKTYTLDEIEFCDGIPWMTYDTVGVLPSNQPEGKKWQLIARDLFTGLTDKNGTEYYHGDRGRFPNGDTFEIRCEDYLEFYVEWIGEPESEDQARDLYRIERAEVTGNIHQD